MYAVCVECSHQRGMGNLFRSLNIIEWFKSHGLESMVLINDDERSLLYLDGRKVPYHVVDLWDYDSNWEKDLIEQYGVHTWIDDRMATDIRHSANVKRCGIKLCSFDDTGSGAELADQNFCAMIFDHIGRLKGRQIFTGIKYMILNQEILQYKRCRSEKKKILVTLGGSDTYGVTVKVARAVRYLPYEFTIVAGYCFENMKELQEETKGSGVMIKNTVPSLIEFFSYFDLAITGGGITSFEACSSGLPCIIIANEHHEEQVGRFFEKEGCAEYLGYYETFDPQMIKKCIDRMDVASMSGNALRLMQMDGLENVMREITK